MEIAALILSIISLCVTVFNTVMFWSKYMSTHTVQLQPVDTFVDLGTGKVESRPIVDQFKDFDDPSLDPDEDDYFKKHN